MTNVNFTQVGPTGSNGNQGPQGPKGTLGNTGLQGIQGSIGGRGLRGLASKTSVGNTTTGDAQTDAMVSEDVSTISSDYQTLLNFVIPRGDKGETGTIDDNYNDSLGNSIFSVNESSGLTTVSSLVATTASISGGTINGTTIGGTTPAVDITATIFHGPLTGDVTGNVTGHAGAVTGSQASAITANTAKVTFPGFGTTSGTALSGDTTVITTAQASAITANTDKVTFPGFGTTSGTALSGDTTVITTAQASAITANTDKVTFPGLGFTSTTALAGDATAASATKIATSRTIGGASFDGSSAIEIQLTTQSTGTTPGSSPSAGTMIFDTNNNKIYIYNGGWRYLDTTSV